jgi:hypothetical protein
MPVRYSRYGKVIAEHQMFQEKIADSDATICCCDFGARNRLKDR